jgi:spore germination protein KA
MFYYARKILRHIKSRYNTRSEEQKPKGKKQAVSDNLQQNLNQIRHIFGPNEDVIIREFSFGQKNRMKAGLVFIDGLIDAETINKSVIHPLMYDSRFRQEMTTEPFNMDTLLFTMLSVGDIRESDDLMEAVDGCLAGDAVFFADGFHKALVISCKGYETRSITEPQTESVIRGPREGFTENLRTNTALLRRKIRNAALTMETTTLGKRTGTAICLAYLKGVASPTLIEEIKNRLKDIDTDSILESGYIEQYIEDAPFSVFATVGSTEKPDVAAAKILEGRAAILVDGTPFVLTAPMLFVENFQMAEDYYTRILFSSLVRIVRFSAYAISLLAPAIYVALTTFHQELIPTALLFTMIAAREGIPFPAVLEAGLMVVAFEILKEAGIRLPRPVGQAISIVGALIMGEAAVSAGLIGAPMVIVIAITAVASFAVPNNIENLAILRLIFLVLASAMGGVGIMIGLLGMLIHLSSLQSFGTPYLSPIAPYSPGGIKDTFIRWPLWAMVTRPLGIAHSDVRRRGPSMDPSDSRDDENDGSSAG